ncbi:MAG: recombination mediator RecR [bacterium]
MSVQSEAIEAVVEHFASLPSIGRKTAQRLAFYLLRQPDEFIRSFSSSLIRMKEMVKSCSVCFTYTEQDPCPICSSTKRDRSLICVVEQPTDVLIIERMSEFKGMYHVLHGNINPLEGVNPDDLKIKELISRLSVDVKEVILALNPTVEGEVTMQYLARMIKPLNITVSRPARGIPIGSELEYTDEATLSKALESRIAM